MLIIFMFDFFFITYFFIPFAVLPPFSLPFTYEYIFDRNPTNSTAGIPVASSLNLPNTFLFLSKYGEF